VQAGERDDLVTWLDHVAGAVSAAIDLDALAALAAPLPAPATVAPLAAPGRRIAIASDRAFAFAYPHFLDDWRTQGAEILPFSPLGDETPDRTADFILLPGGYPELHAATLAAADTFKSAMRAASCPIYGECGGYMVLGEALTDASGTRHDMLGLLDLETSFATRKLHLGYRHVTASAGPFAGDWGAHEFHYATTLRAEGTPLFTATDAEGNALAPMGLVKGQVCGSFAHLIDRGFSSPAAGSSKRE
jgi:cobyrinic acid a,c-diamide synthase